MRFWRKAKRVQPKSEVAADTQPVDPSTAGSVEKLLAIFPYPYRFRGKRYSGSIIDWPNTCQNCHNRACEVRRTNDIETCPYGYNYRWLDGDMLIAGLVVGDVPAGTPAHGKRIRQHRREVVRRERLHHAADAYAKLRTDVSEEVRSEKERILREYVADERFKHEFLNQVRADIQRGLSFVHDYKQLNAQISQNINLLIETSYDAPDFETKLAMANDAEKAIYEAAKFLEEKLNVTKFLINPEWLTRSDDCVTFRFHGLAHKYLKIYEPFFAKKRVRVVVTGVSYSNVTANPQAVSVIPHTLLDNALKYAPRDSRVDVHIADHGETIEFTVRSLGPRIAPDELDRIFDPFYRGEAARASFEEGSGYGLYVSQLIAREHLGTSITVRQSEAPVDNAVYLTEFTIRIPLAAAILHGT